ncbi:MAG TPA: dynamin family protein [bacterium]|nr:dynamin family protein [bacterium]
MSSHQARATANLLRESIDCLAGLGGDFGSAMARIGELHDRLVGGVFHLAVLGQFKRGKSALINALIGDTVLPTGIVPVTAVPTLVRSGSDFRLTIEYEDGQRTETVSVSCSEEARNRLTDLVSETGNPENRRRISRVTVVYPEALLADGVVVIDTPGIGSTLRHNTETAVNFLPHCDAGIFVLSADLPPTEAEVQYLARVRPQIPRLFLVLNKIDRVTSEELSTALAFLRRTLEQQSALNKDTPVFCLSATMGLDARARRDKARWRESGVADLAEHLIRFLDTEKRPALLDAVRLKFSSVLLDTLLRLRLTTKSLEMPLAQLGSRLQMFAEELEKIQVERISTADQLAGDQKRVIDELEAQAETLRKESRVHIRTILQNVAPFGAASGQQESSEAGLSRAISDYFEQCFVQTMERLRARIGEVLGRHDEKLNGIIERIRTAASDSFGIAHTEAPGGGALRLTRLPYWISQEWVAGLTAMQKHRWESFIPHEYRQGQRAKRLEREIETLVVTNVENLRWVLLQSINETFRIYGDSLDERFADTLAATHDAIRSTLQRRRENVAMVERELPLMKQAEERLQNIRNVLTGLGGKL